MTVPACPPTSLAARVLDGDLRAAARLMRDLDDQIPGAADALRTLYPRTGKAFVLGITGNPGAGKSTVVDALIARYRRAGQRVGVVAIDPSSPFSGGAILGDRIRMQRHATDDGVFIRSLATRGHMGGLTRSTGDVVAVLDAMGYGVVIIETVGVGQDEVEVITAADTAVVVTVPGLGDEVQALKAGILEIADVLVVNKADREGTDRTIRDLLTMLQLREGGEAEMEIIRTVATTGEGMDDLVQAIDRHRARAAGSASDRRRKQAEAQIMTILSDATRAAALVEVARRGGLAKIAEDVAARRIDPYTAAESVAAAILR